MPSVIDSLLSRVQSAASLVDKVPLMPARLADYSLSAFFTYQDWRTSRVLGPRPTGAVLLDEYQERRIATDALVPEPFWLETARGVRTRTLASAVWSVRMLIQRAQRGWCAQDLWSLDVSFCTRLADQLDALAVTTHGWPSGEEFPEFDDWAAALHATAASLRRVRPSAQSEQALADWHALRFERPAAEADQDAIDAAWKHLMACEEADSLAVTAALEWVTRHHASLWD